MPQRTPWLAVLALSACVPGTLTTSDPDDNELFEGDIEEDEPIRLDAGFAPSQPPPPPPQPPPPPPGSCAGITACSDCVLQIGCGFCPSTGRCIAGNQSGPANEICPDFGISPATCSAAPASDCEQRSGCDDCVAGPTCGWCATSATCTSGTFEGPARGFCPEWSYYSCQAPAPSCAQNADCASCAATPGCGWCDARGSCEPGSTSGPDSGSCTSWQYTSSACTQTSDPCASSSYDCEACTANSACGFCMDDGACRTGSASGPSSGPCTDWSWYSSSCTSAPPPPPPDPCGASFTCGDCTAAAGCGFCWDDGTCASGTGAGPSNGSCWDWSWEPLDCGGSTTADPCAAAWSCGECLWSAGCGYCWDDDSCASGDDWGPYAGSCDFWFWNFCPGP